MIDASTIAETNWLPTPPQGWFDSSYSVLMDGRLALIRTSIDVHAERLRRWESDVRLSIFDGSTETNVAYVPSAAFPAIDLLADGRWLLVSPRAYEGEKNGRIYSSDGTEEHAMALGDGINSLLCAPDGTLWVGYFDEGIFCGPNKDGSWPVSSGGIVQFDALGKVLWSFNQQVEDNRLVADAYAMTLSGSTLWACYYTGFPIVRLDGVSTSFWSNDIAGASALAVKDDCVILAGGYGKDAGRLAVLSLEGTSSRHVGSLRFKPIKFECAGLVQGRGNIMHIVNDGTWTKIPVASAIQAISSEEPA